VKKTQCAREQFHCQGWRVADVNFAELPTGDSFDRLHRFIHPLHRRAGFQEKDASGFGEPQRFGAVVEKRDAKLIFVDRESGGSTAACET